MKVLLRENVPNLGEAGDVVDVAGGYARNYLLPHNLALEPTDGNLRRVEEEKAQRVQVEKQRVASLKDLAKRIDGVSVTIQAKANEMGHLFGSVTESHIADALQGEGFEIKPEQIALAAPIRTLDKFRVPVHLGPDVNAEVDVWVVPA